MYQKTTHSVNDHGKQQLHLQVWSQPYQAWEQMPFVISITSHNTFVYIINTRTDCLCIPFVLLDGQTYSRCKITHLIAHCLQAIVPIVVDIKGNQGLIVTFVPASVWRMQRRQRYMDDSLSLPLMVVMSLFLHVNNHKDLWEAFLAQKEQTEAHPFLPFSFSFFFFATVFALPNGDFHKSKTLLCAWHLQRSPDLRLLSPACWHTTSVLQLALLAIFRQHKPEF